MGIEVELTGPQDDFVHAVEPYPAFVGGFGSGKSEAGIWRALRLKFGYPGQNVAYYLPTYDLVARMFYPRIEEKLDQLKIRHKINRNDNVVDIPDKGLVIARTMDNPARIVAYEVADSVVDEIDILSEVKAEEAWNKIVARNRQKKPDRSRNTVGVATTPEGFKFVYRKWRKDAAPGYRLIKAPTRSNAHNLPDGYIDDLQNTYRHMPGLMLAYLEGEFVNLTAGSVYAEFDRFESASSETIQTSEPLHIGMDFNVGNMTATVNVLRDGEPHAVDELTGILDTPAMIASIKSRYEGHAILVYPDASGNSRKSNNASESDIALLRTARFQVLVPTSNPAVKDRVMAMNQMICTRRSVPGANGETVTVAFRRMRVNADRCPVLVECLEKQAYDKNGEPDKSGGLDHAPDAQGYFISYRYPVRSRTMQQIKIGGV